MGFTSFRVVLLFLYLNPKHLKRLTECRGREALGESVSTAELSSPLTAVGSARKTELIKSRLCNPHITFWSAVAGQARGFENFTKLFYVHSLNSKKSFLRRRALALFLAEYLGDIEIFHLVGIEHTLELVSYEKSRLVAVGDDNKPSLVAKAPEKRLLFGIVEDTEAVGRYYHSVEKRRKLNFIVLALTEHST